LQAHIYDMVKNNLVNTWKRALAGFLTWKRAFRTANKQQSLRKGISWPLGLLLWRPDITAVPSSTLSFRYWERGHRQLSCYLKDGGYCEYLLPSSWVEDFVSNVEFTYDEDCGLLIVNLQVGRVRLNY
jgi:hypothetical protein